MNYKNFISMSYQTIHLVIQDLDDETIQDFMKQTITKLNSLYNRMSVYQQPLTAREFEYVISKIKKLEIIYGYLYDQIHGTNYQVI